MKKKLLASIIIGSAILSIGSGFILASGDTQAIGAAAVDPGKAYSVEDMMIFAIQDEYLAKEKYEQIMDTYGEQKPLSNIAKAEGNHISALEKLFESKSMVIPENNAKDYVEIPVSLAEAYEAGVQAEIENIALYNQFLERKDIPEDVRNVFESLGDASENHLEAFERDFAKLNR